MLVSLLVQGWSLGFAARLFDVALPHRDRAVRRVEVDLPGSLERELVGYPVAPQAAILGSSRAARLGQARDGRARRRDPDGRRARVAFAPGDYVYLLAPPGRVYRLDWLFAPPDEAREAERELFGEFSFAAYGEARRRRRVLCAAGARARCAPDARRAFRARTTSTRSRSATASGSGPVTLIARELDEDRVAKVGLKIEGVQGALRATPELARARISRPGSRARLFRD